MCECYIVETGQPVISGSKLGITELSKKKRVQCCYPDDQSHSQENRTKRDISILTINTFYVAIELCLLLDITTDERI